MAIELASRVRLMASLTLVQSSHLANRMAGLSFNHSLSSAQTVCEEHGMQALSVMQHYDEGYAEPAMTTCYQM